MKELDEHLENCRKFDLICYKTLLKVIYNIDDIEIVEVSAKRYKEHQRSFFSKSYLKEEDKAKLIIKALIDNKIDILFLQETTDKLVKEIEKATNDFRICKGDQEIDKSLCKSIILIREHSFPGLRSLQEENNIFYRNYRKLDKKDAREAYLSE